MLPIMNPERIERLNQRAFDLAEVDAEDRHRDQNTPEFYDACQAVVREEGLQFVRFVGGDPDRIGMTSGPGSEVWRDPQTGEHVNLWIEADSLGFDDQVPDPI